MPSSACDARLFPSPLPRQWCYATIFHGGYDIISHRRLEFDAGHTDIAQSFMAIRRATTASGNRPTYEASRSEEASHADLAWATMHALFNEPLQGESANTSNIVEIF